MGSWRLIRPRERLAPASQGSVNRSGTFECRSARRGQVSADRLLNSVAQAARGFARSVSSIVGTSILRACGRTRRAYCASKAGAMAHCAGPRGELR
jgi:hypothetical protein